MARYLDESQAAADGLTISHRPEQHRFVVEQNGEVVGEAHYTLIGAQDGRRPGIDFDHTLVAPELRRTGLSGLLAHRALTDEIVRGRRIQASCWFIDGYLARHPELAGEA